MKNSVHNHKLSKYLFKNREEIIVDQKVVPILNWLNSYKGVYTCFSCCGSKKSFPYCSFYSFNNGSLGKIMKSLKKYMEYRVNNDGLKCSLDANSFRDNGFRIDIDHHCGYSFKHADEIGTFNVIPRREILRCPFRYGIYFDKEIGMRNFIKYLKKEIL
jgi:hypothetical protein